MIIFLGLIFFICDSAIHTKEKVNNPIQGPLNINIQIYHPPPITKLNFTHYFLHNLPAQREPIQKNDNPPMNFFFIF